MSEPFASAFVRVTNANRTLKDELTAAIQRQSTPRRISVTHLVNPRQAFFRWKHPEIQPSPDRAQVMMAGTGLHDAFGRTVSTEEFVEQFVEFEEIVGKIDVYEDVPVELKTTASLPDTPAAAARPSYIDQLGMYCTMVSRPKGRLLIYRRTLFGRDPALRAFTVTFSDLNVVRTEMIHRRDLLRTALERDEPGELPQCEWLGRCDYEAYCGCGAAPMLTRVVPPAAYRVERDPALEATLTRALAAPQQRSRAFRLNDLVFPRKSAFERQTPEETTSEPEPAEARMRSMERRAFRDTLEDALRYGIRGAFKTTRVALRGLTDRVGMFRDVPTLVRVTPFQKMVDRADLARAFSYIFDRLAFECALGDREWGRVVLYYQNLPEDKFMVYDVGFRDLAAIRAEADRRLALLESEASPTLLPACPSWMYKSCRFKDRCGCGDAA